MNGDSPRWSTRREALGVVLHRANLYKTLRIALIVGTILFCINQLDVVLAGRATPLVWLKVALTYCVPFVVSNLPVPRLRGVDDSRRGLLIGARRA